MTAPATRPSLATRHLTAGLTRPGSPRAACGQSGPADLADVVRLDARRNWVEQGSKHAKHELGGAAVLVRADRASRRHRTLVCCTFSVRWRTCSRPRRRPEEDGLPPAACTDAHACWPDAETHARLVGPVATAPALVARLVDRTPPATCRG